jgi:hypothetical protein
MTVGVILWNGMDWIDLTQDTKPMEGSCERGDEPPSVIKCLEVLELIDNWRLLRKGSAP